MGNTDKQFVRYPVEICEAFCTYHLSPVQWNIVHYIARKTYGWGKTADYISVRLMSKHLGKSRTMVSGAVNELYKKGVIGVSRDKNGRPAKMWIQPPEEWDKPVTISGHVTETGHVTKTRRNLSGNHDNPLSGNHDRNLSGNPDTQYINIDTSIDTIQKKEPSAPISEDDDDGWEGESWGE